MPLVSQSVSDNQYYHYVNKYGGNAATGSLNDLDRREYGAAPNESVADARRRVLLTYGGANSTDSLSDLERNWYYAFWSSHPELTNQDLEYLVYQYYAPPSQATNLLTANQASVETDLSGFWPLGPTPPTLTRDATAAVHGSYGLKRVETGTISWESLIEFRKPVTGNQLPVTAGVTYTFTATVRATSGTREHSLSLTFADNNTQLPGTPIVYFTPTAQWQTFTVTGVAPPTAVMVLPQLYVTNNGAVGDTTLWDKFGLWQGTGGAWNMPGEPIDFNKYNLLTANQASVETDLTELSTTNGSGTLTRSTVRAVHGNASALVTMGASPGNAGIAMFIAHLGNLQAGKTYTISGKVYSSVTADYYAYIYKPTPGFVFGPNINVPANTWTTVSFSVTIPVSGTDWGIYIQPVSNIPAGSLTYYDCLGFWEGTGGNWAMPGEPITGVS